MGSIQINTSIFPMIMSISVGENENKQKIDLPAGANLLYLQGLSDETEKSFLKKYARGDIFSDEEFEKLFNLFFDDSPRVNQIRGDLANFINQFGVEMDCNDGVFTFSLLESHKQQIKVETWECITLDLLKSDYEDIINCFDFGEINIYLGGWKSETDEIRQSLLNALRAALMFTLIGFLYGDDRHLYNDFKNYFETEFYKRVALVYGVWKTRKNGEKVEYIPIYDSFYNLKNKSTADLISTIHAILDCNDIVMDERMMLKNRLISGAEVFHANIDPQSILLEQTLIKPVVNFLAEISSAKDNLNATDILLKQSLFNPSIDRSYYSMMHALKALLEKNGLLADWNADPLILNVPESHAALERKLNTAVNNGIIDNTYYIDFKYVKQKRWAADYNITQFSEVECTECMRRAELFYNEIKRLTT